MRQLLLAHGLRGKEQDGAHLGIAELIIVLKLPHRRIASQLPQQLRHGDAMPFDRRFAAKNFRVGDDTWRKLAPRALSPLNSLASGRVSILHRWLEGDAVHAMRGSPAARRRWVSGRALRPARARS